MAALEKICWVILDDVDITHLNREHTVESAHRVTTNPTASADEHIVAKVYLGASGANGLNMIERNERKIGPLLASAAFILIFATALGLVDIASTFWRLIT